MQPVRSLTLQLMNVETDTGFTQKDNGLNCLTNKPKL